MPIFSYFDLNLAKRALRESIEAFESAAFACLGGDRFTAGSSAGFESAVIVAARSACCDWMVTSGSRWAAEAPPAFDFKAWSRLMYEAADAGSAALLA